MNRARRDALAGGDEPIERFGSLTITTSMVPRSAVISAIAEARDTTRTAMPESRRELRENVIEQAGVLDRRRGSHHQRAVLRAGADGSSPRQAQLP